MKIYFSALLVLACLFSTAATSQDFNPYILKAIDKLYKERKGGGYDIHQAFTHNVNYDGANVIKATKPTLTMCVAAVSEIIIYATKIYAEETGDKSVFTKIPAKAWISGGPLSLKANIFMFAGTGSRGTGFTLKEFGLGEELTFASMKPGDFVNFNRAKTGHSAVLTGFIHKDNSVSTSYSSDVIGFRYFSAQGKGKPDAGFAYRNGYFGACPADAHAPRDCGIIRSTSPVLFNTGRMWSPDRWAYLEAIKNKTEKTRSIFESEFPEQSKGAISALVDAELNKELKFDHGTETLLDGVTTD